MSLTYIYYIQFSWNIYHVHNFICKSERMEIIQTYFLEVFLLVFMMNQKRIYGVGVEIINREFINWFKM